jgi:hypothetical protein
MNACQIIRSCATRCSDNPHYRNIWSIAGFCSAHSVDRKWSTCDDYRLSVSRSLVGHRELMPSSTERQE